MSMIDVVGAEWRLSRDFFIGLIIIPIVGNAAEHVSACVSAIKNKMDLALGIAIWFSLFSSRLGCSLLGSFFQRAVSLVFVMSTFSVPVSVSVSSDLFIRDSCECRVGVLSDAAADARFSDLRVRRTAAVRHGDRRVTLA